MGISNNNNVPGSLEYWLHEINWYTEEVESPRFKPDLRMALRSFLVRDASREKVSTGMLDQALDTFYEGKGFKFFGELNKNGNWIVRSFYMMRERYHYDFHRCPRPEWYPVQTWQDASYFGVWVNEKLRQIMTFAEGDETLVTALNGDQFEIEWRTMYDFYKSGG